MILGGGIVCVLQGTSDIIAGCNPLMNLAHVGVMSNFAGLVACRFFIGFFQGAPVIET